MARKLINMRYVKDILRLKHQNQLSVREIAGSCGLPTSTVGDYLQRAEAAGLSWPLPEGLCDAELAERLLKLAVHRPEWLGQAAARLARASGATPAQGSHFATAVAGISPGQP